MQRPRGLGQLPGCEAGATWEGVCAKSLQLCLTLQPHELKHSRLLCPWDSPGKNTQVGCRAPLQGIFPTQGLNPHSQAGSLPPAPPRVDEWEGRGRRRPGPQGFMGMVKS